MQFLELAESTYYVRILCKFFGLLTDGNLGLHVLLEVILAELVVQLLYVIELLGVLLVGFPEFIGLIGRNFFYLFPLLEQGLELIV